MAVVVFGLSLFAGTPFQPSVPTEWLPWIAKSRRFWKVLPVVGLILYPGFVIIVLAVGAGDSTVEVAMVSASIIPPA
jgi:hypothetical protein